MRISFFYFGNILRKMLKQVQHDTGDTETSSAGYREMLKLVQCDAKGGFLELEFGFYEVVEKIYGLDNA